MSEEIKAALASFDLNKTGGVSTSELIAGAKALEEVRNGRGTVELQSRAFELRDPQLAKQQTWRKVICTSTRV